MKIQLDTENKTIKLENSVKLSKLVETLERLLPNEEWKEFELQTNTVINHFDNIIKVQPYHEHYHYPWYGTHYADYRVRGENTLLAKTNAVNLKTGIYNVEA